MHRGHELDEGPGVAGSGLVETDHIRVERQHQRGLGAAGMCVAERDRGRDREHMWPS